MKLGDHEQHIKTVKQNEIMLARISVNYSTHYKQIGATRD